MNFTLPKRSIFAPLLIGGLLMAALPGRAAEDKDVAAAKAEAPIELPKFEVTDSRLLPPPESWRYTSIPGFEVLSTISARETTRFVKDFFMLQSGLDAIMPGFATPDVAMPTSLILTGRGKGFDRFLPAVDEEARYRTNGLFFSDAERGVIVVDFALAELQLEDNTTMEADPYRAFYNSYFHYLIRRQAGDKAPPWFTEGLVQLFSQIDVNKKWINFAQIGDGFGGPRDGDFNQILGQRALMPFSELFADQPNNSTFWKAQSYAFVHMCLYGRGQIYQKGFIKFVSRLSNEALTEAIFKECFGKDYKQMGLELRGYIGFTDYKSMQYTAKKGTKGLPDPPEVKLRDATDAEVGRIIGAALRMGSHGDEAHNMLIAPYQRGERDPQLLAALGLDERQAGHDDRARKFLEAAAKAKVERPRAYLELAQLRLDEVKAKPAAGEKLSTAQVSTVLEPLLIARKQRPPMAAVYGLIAETWNRSAVPPTKEEFNVVLEGVQTFPRSTGLVLQATILAVTQHFTKEATILVNHGQKIARDDSTRSRFEVLAQALARDASPETAKPAPAAQKPDSYLPNLK
jgi:hypothetical protein